MNHKLQHDIMQDLVWGESPQTVAMRYEVPIEAVLEVVAHAPGILPAKGEARRALALARLDILAQITMQAAKSADVGAIRAYLEIQKREAALTGMDTPTRTDTTITVDVPWLKAQRLAYKENKDLATDIMARPLISVNKPDSDD